MIVSVEIATYFSMVLASCCAKLNVEPQPYIAYTTNIIITNNEIMQKEVR